MIVLSVIKCMVETNRPTERQRERRGRRMRSKEGDRKICFTAVIDKERLGKVFEAKKTEI